MPKKKTKKSESIDYLVLTNGRDDKSGIIITKGETVNSADIPPYALKAWLEMNALEVKNDS